MSPSITRSEDEAASEYVLSVEPFTTAVVAGASATLLTHRMPTAAGREVAATTVLFVPRQAAPAGGWPIVAWVHGTTTGGQKLRAPSLSPTFDGGLTADGSVTEYVWVLESLIAAGFAVVAPDLEGLGPAAVDPHPYFSTPSLARSVISGVRAARSTTPELSSRWMSVGHSEGGHGALSADAYADEAPELSFHGSVAFAPLSSVSAIVAHHGSMASAAPDVAVAVNHVVQQNFNVTLIAAGMAAENPAVDLGNVMGPDLVALMGSVTGKGSVEIVRDITSAVTRRGISEFDGFRAGWDQDADAARFLAQNDLVLMP